MFRIAPKIIQTRCILQRKIPLQVQTTSICRLSPLQDKTKDYLFREREVCPKPPPCPPPPRKKRPWLWQLLGLVAATAAFTVYAHENPKVRDWLSMNAPWFDDWIAFVYQENEPFPDSLVKAMCYNRLTKFIDSYRKKEENKICKKPQLESDTCLPGKQRHVEAHKTKEQLAEEKVKAAAEEAKKIKEGGAYTFVDKEQVCEQYDPQGGKEARKKAKEEEEERQRKEAKKPKEVKKKHKEPTKEELAEMSKCVGELTQCIKCNVESAKDACKSFNKAAERAFRDYNTADFKKVECKMDKRRHLVKHHLEKINDSRKRLKETKVYVECAVKDPKTKKELEDVLATSSSIIEKADKEFQRERSKSKQLIKKYYMVKPFMEKFIEENQMYVRGLNYEEKPQYYFDGDLDLLLQHTVRYKRLLSKRLSHDRKHLAKRADKAFDSLACDEKGRKQHMNKVTGAYAARLADVDKEISERYTIQNKENDEALQKALKAQKEKFEAKISKLLKAKETEAADKLKSMVAEKVEAERESMRQQLADMKKQLKKVEEKLKANMRAEEEAVKAQALYAAGSSLLAATRRGDHKRVCVTKELTAIKRSGRGDELVTTVLKTIPPEVHKYGIVPESALIRKFRQVEDVARKVALVEAEGSPLPVYLMSWLQAKLLFRKIDHIPLEEKTRLPNQEISVEGLDTFEILARARYWMEHGELARALEYVDKLEGASRGAARRWYTAARAHLETRQAAHAVIAHAANINLNNV